MKVLAEARELLTEDGQRLAVQTGLVVVIGSIVLGSYAKEIWPEMLLIFAASASYGGLALHPAMKKIEEKQHWQFIPSTFLVVQLLLIVACGAALPSTLENIAIKVAIQKYTLTPNEHLDLLSDEEKEEFNQIRDRANKRWMDCCELAEWYMTKKKSQLQQHLFALRDQYERGLLPEEQSDFIKWKIDLHEHPPEYPDP